MMNHSRNIPLPMKREIRQRCSFGCVICGHPLYEYHHMVDWSKSKEHRTDEITLLCDSHHKQATKGLLVESLVRKFNENPHNSKSDYSSSMPLYFDGDSINVEIGGNVFEMSSIKSYGYFAPIEIDGIPIIGFRLEGNNLLLHMNLFDRYNNPLMQIVDSELYYSIEPWDIELTGKKLMIRDKPRSFNVDILLDTPNRIVITKGDFMCNGIKILVSEKELIFQTHSNTNVHSGNLFADSTGGIVIGKNRNTIGGMYFPNIERY